MKWDARKFMITFIYITVIVSLVFLGIIRYFNKNEVQADKIITIGFCADNLVIERWQKDQEIFQAKATAEGIEVIVYNANESNEIQNQQIRLLIEKEVDVIVVIPYDKDGITNAVSEAKKAGIKVIAYDRLINNADIDAYISFDNVKVGELMADELIKVVPKGNYIIINGSPEDNNSYMFREGYLSGIQSSIERNEIEIVKEIWAENWREAYAYDAVHETLSTGVKVQAIIGANDRLAEAAIRALAENGLAGKVYVAGHDADISACQRIVEGTQYMTVYKPIRQLAEAAVDLAIDLATEEPMNNDEFIDNGFKEVPYYKLDVLPVTLNTIESTVIEDGFHQREEIYREP